MSNDITETRRGAITAPAAGFEQTKQRVQQVLDRFYKLLHGEDPPIGLYIEGPSWRFPLTEKSLPALDAIRPEAEAAFADLQRQARPATLEEIVKQIANGTEGDISGFGSELLDYVLETKPAIGDIDEARHALVLAKVSGWMPSIGEVVEAIAQAKESRQTLTIQIHTIMTGRDRIVAHKAQLAQEERKHLEQEQRAKYLAPPDTIGECVNELPL
jgi:hypothetical protein